MSMIDKAFGPQIETLRLRGQRSVVLANNIANAETPHYLARDIDFKAVMAQTSGGMAATRTHAGHQSIDNSGMPELAYRIPTQSSSDGNTVEPQIEKTQFAENASRLSADLTFLNSRINGLLRAMKSE